MAISTDSYLYFFIFHVFSIKILKWDSLRRFAPQNDQLKAVILSGAFPREDLILSSFIVFHINLPIRIESSNQLYFLSTFQGFHFFLINCFVWVTKCIIDQLIQVILLENPSTTLFLCSQTLLGKLLVIPI